MGDFADLIELARDHERLMLAAEKVVRDWFAHNGMVGQEIAGAKTITDAIKWSSLTDLDTLVLHQRAKWQHR